MRDQTLMAQPIDSKTFAQTGDLFPVAEQVSRGPAAGSYLYSLSDNGALIYQTGAPGGTERHLWFDRAGKEAGAVGGMVRSQGDFAISADGKRLVIGRISDSSAGSDLWVTDLEHNGTETRFTFDASFNSHPVWSPDGSKIAFGSNRRGGIQNLYQRASNNTGEDEALFESKEVQKYPWDWSRDGRFIIFHAFDQKIRDDIWVLPLTGDRKPSVVLATPFREMQGQLSPDSRWLAYTTDASGRFEIEVQPFAPGLVKPFTGKWQISTAGGVQPRWRSDGKELYYQALDRKMMAVEIRATGQSFDHGPPQALFESQTDLPTNAGIWGYVPSADGRRFLIAIPPATASEAPPLTVVVNWPAGIRK